MDKNLLVLKDACVSCPMLNLGKKLISRTAHVGLAEASIRFGGVGLTQNKMKVERIYSESKRCFNSIYALIVPFPKFAE